MGLAAVTLLAERLNAGQAVTSAGELGRRLKVSPEALNRALSPLIDTGLVSETTGGFEAFVLGRAPGRLPLDAVFEAYDPDFLPEPLKGPLKEIRHQVQTARRDQLASRTVADLVAPPPDEPSPPTLPAG